ncbi:hypothetical protein [Vibrio gazogenes]|uniref:Protein involved in propanediol utilization n=1 Tax=Vibrio gazogenes DSM 21264 = NBRC 103151 TaxID=1123492 RepID=A0A1M4YUY9_VIBGA|nr:hypothetical protein [Vibrio gazogenes]USP15107.1 hypothetical protein MKS89_07365 [Vibrio gazogenes]SHF09555.1 Protein involved in propanediol utilization [Vibrio gazogenes DSM 21264] [Vibrio gazogenes DSM 21264 = NBRC 103151]SJN56401.1 hypothetical protein BQ6471_02023 [Vibrio gazogenes]
MDNTFSIGKTDLSERTYSSRCRGTLGELFQGPFFTKEGVDIAIISAVADKYVKASFTINESEGDCNLKELGKTKVKRAIDNYCHLKGISSPTGNWSFKSELKVGAGMSSSTSDIVAALKCFSSHMNKELTFYDIVNSLSGVERSDTVFLEQPCLYLSRKQQIIDIYKPQGKIYCYYAIESNVVDTTSTKDALIDHYIENKNEYSILLDDVYSSFKSGDLKKICECSTKSALLSQGIMPKKNFWHFYSSLNQIKSDGLIVAHTGSLIGLLFCKEPEDSIKEDISKLFSESGLEVEKGIIG